MVLHKDTVFPIRPRIQVRETVNRLLESCRSVVESPRAGGSYRITNQAVSMLIRETNSIGTDFPARTTKVLVDERQSSKEYPNVKAALIAMAEESSQLASGPRAAPLLRFMRIIIDGEPTLIPLFPPNLRPAAIAQSESATVDKLGPLLRHLASQALVALSLTETEWNTPITTVNGDERVKTLTNPSQATLHPFGMRGPNER